MCGAGTPHLLHRGGNDAWFAALFRPSPRAQGMHVRIFAFFDAAQIIRQRTGLRGAQRGENESLGFRATRAPIPGGGCSRQAEELTAYGAGLAEPRTRCVRNHSMAMARASARLRR